MSTKENAYQIADLPEIQEVNGAANTLRWQADRIEELEAALTDIRDARPVKLADGLVSSPQELVVQMQQRADRVLEQLEGKE